MRWRKKKHISRQGLSVLSRPIVLAIIIMIVSFVSIVSSKTVQAGKYDDWMNDEFKKYANSSAAKACSEHIRSTKFNILDSRTWPAVKDFANGVRKVTGDPTHTDTSIRPIGREDSKDLDVYCDINSFAEAVTGEKNYFCNYLKKNPYIDVGLIKGDNAKAHLDNCDLSSLQISPELWIGALDSIPKYTPSNAVKYAAYRDAIEKHCLNNPAFTEAENGDKFWSKVGDDGNWVTVRGYPNYKDNNPNAVIRPMYDEMMTCAEATQKASKLADDYTKAVNEYLEKHPEERKNQKKEEEERLENQKGGDECAAELNGFGSIICSGQNLFETITNILYGTIAKMLVDQTELTKSDTVRKHWGNFLNVANIILIIAFLVVIYSTATSTGGLSNYDVKKLLPRIIIFAIAINLSFYICMALVDLSTIVGKGIFGLLMGGSTGAPPQLINSAQKTAGEINSFVAGVALVAIAAVLVILVGAPIILALLAIVFALVVRGIALMILVIISPVAIALYLFNNQGLSKGFTMWRDNYIKLLLVYPLFMLVWGGTRVVSGLVNQGDQDGINALFVLLVETICLITPALSIMPLFKASGDIMGKATLMAATNGAANKFAGWAGSKATGARDKVGKAIGGAVAGAAGAAAGRAAGAVQNMRGGASTGNIATQLDDQAMNSARNKVDKYSASDRHDAFTTGQINGQTLKPYEMRAVIEKELPNASSTDVKQSMHAVNNEAQRLKKNGQNADADKLLRTFATTASANKNSQMSSKSLNDFANSGGWSMGQFEAKYADAVADYATNEMTAQDIASTDAANLAQMRQTLQYSADSGGSEAAADAGMRSMARQSNIALSDPSLNSKMNAQTASELRDNTLLRSTAGEKLANTYKIPNIYHDYNAGGGSSAIAKLHANKMMRHSDFGKLDAIDQSRLRAIASASVPTGTGAPTTPVAIASWDRRA